MAILLPAAVAGVKVPGHSTLDSLEAKGNHLGDVSVKNAAFKGTNNQTPVMVQKDVPPKENLQKLTRDAQQLAPERKKRCWKSNNCWFNQTDRTLA